MKKKSPKKLMNGYEFLETISKGAHSTIIHSQQPSTNTIAVTKCIELSKLGKKCLENLDKLKESNKNVCKLITKFSDAKIQYLVYEYCNGDTLALPFKPQNRSFREAMTHCLLLPSPLSLSDFLCHRVADSTPHIFSSIPFHMTQSPGQ